jgi:hypothetical protein
MGFYDFVAGIVLGIIMACLIFVVQTSRVSAIRATYSGTVVESTVRRHPVHRRFLNQIGGQIKVAKLAGYLFFGSIVAVEKRVRNLIQEEAFSKQPIRYLILDFRYVSGLDFSAAEAFVRMNRVLRSRDVEMVLSGVSVDGEVGQSLAMVGLLETEENEPPKIFEDLNQALESCENELLIAFKQRSDLLAKQRETSNLATSMSWFHHRCGCQTNPFSHTRAATEHIRGRRSIQLPAKQPSRPRGHDRPHRARSDGARESANLPAAPAADPAGLQGRDVAGRRLLAPRRAVLPPRDLLGRRGALPRRRLRQRRGPDRRRAVPRRGGGAAGGARPRAGAVLGEHGGGDDVRGAAVLRGDGGAAADGHGGGRGRQRGVAAGPGELAADGGGGAGGGDGDAEGGDEADE